uniref:Secreted protein n=1 Tax=Angiostrongylus cantonensis TaxID=6313 RepID=A0A0K0D4K8_ANGCA
VFTNFFSLLNKFSIVQCARQYHVCHLFVIFIINFHMPLEAPASAASVYKDASYSCLFESECNRMDSEVIHGFVNNFKIFIKVMTYLAALYTRNNSVPQVCALLILILLDHTHKTSNEDLPSAPKVLNMGRPLVKTERRK